MVGPRRLARRRPAVSDVDRDSVHTNQAVHCRNGAGAISARLGKLLVHKDRGSRAIPGLANSFEQLGRCHAERFGDLGDRRKPGVAARTLE